MRVNIIGAHRPDTGVSQDARILHGLIAHVFGKETEVRYVPHVHPQCPEAELNFFIEVVNPSLFTFARKNIWIPNPEWTCKTWEPYASMVDAIWVKTKEAERIFQEWTGKVTYIGWTSIDKVQPDKKNYHKAIVPVGKNIWRNPKPIVQAYLRILDKDAAAFKALPELHIVSSLLVPPIPERLQDKIKVHAGVLKEAEYDELLQECGLCICMSAAEGFGHAVNEALSAGCVTILPPIEPFRELTSSALWVSTSKTTPHPQCLGVLEDVEIDSLVDALQIYCAGTFTWRKSLSNLGRSEYEDRHQAFIKRMEEVLSGLKETPAYSIEARLPKEADLPPVSIITITKNRRPFIPLAKYNFLAQAYPEDKIEWVIVDDGIDQIKDLVSDLPNVKYILCDDREGGWTIGAKRNLAVEQASHDILVVMDDDDVYPNNSILTRVAYLLAEPVAGCTFCTVLPSFDIHRSTSFMNVPPITLPMADRVSEATLCFTRAFWEAQKFPDQQIAEGGAFLRSREAMCRELSPQDVIVSLTHSKTTSSRKAPPGEPNGCHYGFADELYTLVREIAEAI